MRPDLWIGAAGGADLALQAWVARSLACFDAAEEGGKRFVRVVQHVLQGLRAEVTILRPHRLDGRQVCRLHGNAHRDATLLPGGCAFLQTRVGELAAALQHHTTIANACSCSGVGIGLYVKVLRTLCWSIRISSV
jgi:hypothetical protein